METSPACSRRRCHRIARSRLACERLEARRLLTADLVLSEFMASNTATLDDGFGDSSDWIEIYNRGDEPVDLQGHYLTDKVNKPTKWRFPTSAVLEPGEYLVVFASGRNQIDPAGHFHTNFSLSAGGEYVGLRSPAGILVDEFGSALSEYPPQISDISYGIVNGPLVSPETAAWYLIPEDGSLGSDWTANDFDAAANGFTPGTAAIGYEEWPDSYHRYLGLFSTAVPAGTTSVYARMQFELTDAATVSDLTLGLKYDDGFAAYLNGSFLFSRNAGNGLTWDAIASAHNADSAAVRYENFKLDGSSGAEGDFRSLLVDGTNTLAIQMLNQSPESSDFLMAPLLTTNSLTSGEISYLTTASPGAANSPRLPLGPTVSGVTASGRRLLPGEDLVFTARVTASDHPVDPGSVVLHTRRMFEAEATIAMNDAGADGDGVAGDGIYSATVPGSSFVAGEMFRWYVTADDIQNRATREPRFLYPADSAEYFGTVVVDGSIAGDLPVMSLFVQDPAAAETRAGTRASLFYRDIFYDNVQIDLHGQSTSFFPKKSFDIDANSGEKFDLGPAIGIASDFNLLTNYADQTKVRHPLAYEAFAFGDHPALAGYPVVVHRNGSFLGLYDVIEEIDEEYLERVGLDPNGAAYKVNNWLNSATTNVEKKSREYEDHSDFQEVVDANGLSGAAATTWDFDNLEIASLVNNLAIHALIGNHDYGHKNMLWYHDNDGTGQWFPLPWDQDLSFGHHWRDQYFDNGMFLDSNLTAAGTVAGNNVFKRFFEHPDLAEMFFRRLRSLSDAFYGLPGSPVAESHAYRRIEEQRLLTETAAAADLAAWGLHSNFRSYPNTPSEAVDQLQDVFLDGRRTFITADPRVPAAQRATAVVTINTDDFDATPISGNPAEQYLRLDNVSSEAVDISGWQLVGDVEHTFRGGTVIPAGGSLYVVKNVPAFLARTSGPRGGQQRFIQGNYAGSFSSLAAVSLRRPDTVFEVAEGAEQTDPVSRAGPTRLVKRGSGRLVLDRANDHANGTLIEAGELLVRAAGALGSGQVAVEPGAALRLDVGYETVAVGGLAMAPGASLDLGTAELLLPAGSLDPQTLRQQLIAGRGDGSWASATGIGSSAAAADAASRAVGYRVEPSGETRVSYTAIGDVNLDRVVDVFDLLAISTGGRYGTGGSASWGEGDLNYDGITDLFDVLAISTAGTYAAGSIVPTAQAAASAAPLATTGTLGQPKVSTVSQQAFAQLAAAFVQDDQDEDNSGPSGIRQESDRSLREQS